MKTRTLDQAGMKKIGLLFILFSTMLADVSSQSCLPEGIVFTTQAQIDSFQIYYPNPFKHSINIDLPGGASLFVLEFTNSSGALLSTN